MDEMAWARQAVQMAQERMKQQYDKHRQDEQFVPGDKVLLSMGKGKQLKLNVPGQTDSRKSRMKYIGPYKVEEQVSKVAYRLALPKHMKVHPVFHVDRLRPWKQSS